MAEEIGLYPATSGYIRVYPAIEYFSRGSPEKSGNRESSFHLLGQAHPKRNFRWEGGRDNTALADSLGFELAEKQHSAAGVS